MKIEREDGWVLPPPHEVLRLEEARTHWLSHSGATAAWLDELELPWNASREAFQLEIGHFVGVMPRLRLLTESGETEYRVEVLPREEKLSPEAWSVMLADLDAWLSGVTVGSEIARHGEVSTAGASAPWLVSALLPLLPALRDALQRIADEPRERSRTELEDVPLHAVRRADSATIRWLSRHPEAVLGRRGDFDGRPPLVPQRLARETFDHPANRYLVWLVRRIVETLEGCAEKLEQLSRTDRAKADEAGQKWLSAKAARCADEAEKLDAMRKRSFLRSLPSQTATEAALTVFQDDPRYARFHRLARPFLSPRFRLRDSENPKAAIRPSFDLYELWTFLAMEHLLRQALPNAKWSQKGYGNLLRLDSHGTGAHCSAALPEGTLELHFNLRFRSYLKRGEGKRFSLSRARRPDLVVTWKPHSGDARWICLDAKYRVSAENLGDAFQSLHIYRDSLIYEDFGDKCRAAWLLVPAQEEGCEEWFSAKFFEDYGLGAVQLTPGESRPIELVVRIFEKLGLAHPKLANARVPRPHPSPASTPTP